MRKSHRKTLLTLCAGLVLCLCMTACTTGDININIDGDINVGTTDTSGSETGNTDNDNTGSENENDEDPTNPDPDGPDDSGDTPLDPENPDEGGDDNPNPDDPSQGDNPDPDPDDPGEGGGDTGDTGSENPDEGGDGGDDNPNPDDPGSGTSPDPNPDDPEGGDEHGDDDNPGSGTNPDPDPENPDESGDGGDDDDNPNPDDPSQGGDDNPDPNPENPDEGGDDDNPNPDDPSQGGGDDNPDPDPDEGDDNDDEKGEEPSEPIKHEYTYSASTNELNANGGSFTYDGLTWTFSSATALSKDSNNRGVQIGTSKNAQSTPWTFSTDFGEMVLLESVNARIYTSTSSGLTAHYELTLDSSSLGSSDFHSNNSSDVCVAEGTGLPLYGQVLTLSVNAVNETAFYFESISLVYYTNVGSGDTGGNTGDPETPGEEETDEYTYYQGYSHKFANGEFTTSGGTLTTGGLTWTYSGATYVGSSSSLDVRGAQIGSSSSAQTTAWTISTDFGGETVKLTQATVYLFTGKSGSAKYTLTFDSNTLATGSFANSSNASSLDDATIVECSDLEYIGNSFSLTLQASSKAMYLYGISLSVMTKSDTSLNLSEETLVGDDYVAEAVVPGVNGVLSTKYNSLDADSYYSTYSIDWTKTGDDLRSNLQDVCTPQTTYTYGDIRYMLPYSDEDPDNPGYMYGLYDGDKIPAYWEGTNSNREHVWPCAHMKIGSKDRPDNSDSGHYSDLHNLRICCALTNSYKSDKYLADTDSSLNFFANQSDPSSLGSHPYSEGNREGDHRGDVARICLYMYVVYDGLDLKDGITSSTNDVTYGQLNTLLKWNYEDEPDEFEMQRNNRIYEYQGNRNPFIDYPQLADSLFPNLDSYFTN